MKNQMLGLSALFFALISGGMIERFHNHEWLLPIGLAWVLMLAAVSK